jgi:hypothetical protein
MMLAAVETSTLLALGGIFLLWFAFKRLGRRPAKLSSQLPVSRPASPVQAADSHHLDAPATVVRWEVAMHETARDLMGRLDSKIVIVERLTREASLAAARLEAVLRRIEQAGGIRDCSPSDASAPGPSAGQKAADHPVPHAEVPTANQ